MDSDAFRETLTEYLVKAGRIRTITLMKKLVALRKVKPIFFSKILTN